VLAEGVVVGRRYRVIPKSTIRIARTTQMLTRMGGPLLGASAQWRVYSADGDIAAETELSTTGTKLDIAATDQAKPIATTTPITIMHARICIPSAWGFAYFFAPQCEIVHKWAKFF
jgi:hypothetical protein